MNKLRDILTAPMARNPFLFVRKVRQKTLGKKPGMFVECPVSALDYESLQPLVSHLRSWVDGLEERPCKLEWNEVFQQEFNLDFLLERCRAGALSGDTSLQGDIKLPWEFSRGYSFIVNALCCETDEQKDRCAQEIADCMHRWWEHNNDPDGVNWIVAMEVGIRAFNWVCADAVLDGRVSSIIGRETFDHWLWNHGCMIWDRLEYTMGGVSNHYTADLMSLTILGLIFSDTAKGRRWLRFAKREMQTSIIHHQTNPDGGLKENSLRYHCLVTEMCLHFYALMEGQVNEWFKDRLILMCEVMAAYRDASCGDVFAFGDDDGARIIPLDFVVAAGRADLLCVYAANMLERTFDIPRSVVHPESGWAALRLNGFELATEYGRMCGGHAHNDTLSFCLNYEGVPIFADPGSGIYTANLPLRDQLRGMHHHSVVELDGQPQGVGGAGAFGAFVMEGSNRVCCVAVDTNSISMKNHAPAHGATARHDRTVRVDENGLMVHISDTVVGAERKITWNFVLHPSASAKAVESGFSICLCDGTEVRLISGTKFDYSIESGRYSDFYGRTLPTSILQATTQGCFDSDKPLDVEWRIYI